jgi:hypothetical protein
MISLSQDGGYNDSKVGEGRIPPLYPLYHRDVRAMILYNSFIFIFPNVPTHIFERSENNVQSVVGDIKDKLGDL